MDITNVNVKDSMAPAAVNLPGTTSTSKPTTHGNSLPDMGQINSPAENVQDGVPASHLDSERLQGLVDQVNKALSTHTSNLKFTVAEGTDVRVVRIEDTQTGKLIRQFPSEAVVALARALGDSKQGTMLEERA